jgi:hypothetical protein
VGNVGVDEDRLWQGESGHQPNHHPGEDLLVAPSLPSILEGVGRTEFRLRSVSEQSFATAEDYTTQNR